MAQDNFAAVRERVDPVALVESLTKARVKSRTPTDVRLAPCPFCGSKTGFSVNPQTKTYCCHHAGCDAEGDVFTFVMRIRGFTRKFDALKFLAERVGHDLPKVRPLGDRRLEAILELAQEMKQAAAEYYAERLWASRDEEFTYTRDGAEHTATVLGYHTETRGHSEGVLKYMRVGWADGGLLSHLKERYRGHVDRELAFAALIASGLVKKTHGRFHDLFRRGGYVYPVVDAGRVITLTAKYPDDGISNYQLPRTVEINEREVAVWGTPFYFLNHEALGENALVLVEGEDDLLTVMDLGRYAAVCGLRGTPNREQLAALAERRKGKRTFLCFDNDDAGRELTWRVAGALADADYDVRVVPVPPEHKDIDDALRAAGREPAGALFSSLLEQAPTALDHLSSFLERELPEPDRNELAERFARLAAKQPPLTRERLQKRMREALGASARTVQQIIAKATKSSPKTSSWRPLDPERSPLPTGIRGLYYRWTDQGLEKVEVQEVEGKTLEHSVVVSDFLIRIERISEVIDDLKEHKELDCRLLLKGDDLDSPGRTLRLASGRLGSNAGLAEALASAGFPDLGYTMQDMDFIRLASGKFSHDRGIARVQTVRYIGYAKTESGEGQAYVSPSAVVRDGEIIPAGEALERYGLRCELPREAFKAVENLDLAIVSDDDFRAALASITTDLMAFKGPKLGRAFLGHTFLAPVLRRLRGFKPYILFFHGSSGVVKSTLAGYCQAFFGPGFNDSNLENWASTPKAIERAGHYFKDALYVVDDFKFAHFSPGGLADAMRLMQSYTDGAGRNRLTRTSEMKASAYIRGMLATIGEDLPEGESSNLARMIVLRTAAADPTQERTDCKRRLDEACRLYAGVMARYIAWTQTKDDEYFQSFADELYDKFAQSDEVRPVAADNKPRILQNLALNCLGFALWLDFAHDSGAVDEAAGRREVQSHFDFLKGLFLEQTKLVSEERPFILFLRHVSAMLDSRVVRIDEITPRMTLKGGFSICDGRIGGGERLVGYYDDTHYYFLHDAIYKEVGEYRNRGKLRAGAFSKLTIIRQLYENGILVPNPTKSGTHDIKKYRIYVDGATKYVIKIERAKFDECIG